MDKPNTKKEMILTPIKETTEDYERLERAIQKLFRDLFYLPLLKEIGEPSTTIKNAKYDLLEAIRTGRITFQRGVFKGKFSATLSRELKEMGAKWDRRQGVFKLPLGSLSPELQTAVSLAEHRVNSMIAKFDKRLTQFLPEEIAASLKTEKIFDTMLFKLDRNVKKSLKGLVVSPELTKEQKDKIAVDYTTNLQKYIKDFTEKEIVNLREKMQKTVMAGNRYETMIKTIKESYGVSQNKAKFLARQETGLLMAKFKESRYQAAGVDEYIWGCVAGSSQHPVRPMHKALEGKRFKWNNPPITSEDGRRNNPHEDFNCRCFAKPIVSFK